MRRTLVAVIAGLLDVIVLVAVGGAVASRWAPADDSRWVRCLILATKQLHTVGATMELPRTVSTVFVVAAFAVLLKSTSSLRSAGAGGLVAIASAMRFSEEIFVAPVVVQLAIQRRWRDLTAFALVFLLTALAIFGVVDQMYWANLFSA